MTEIAASLIRTDGGTQTRASLSQDVIAEYAAAMRDGARFPAVTAFYDGAEYWLADGFHRTAAAALAGLTQIACDVQQGTRRDAILHSVGANGSHGLRRTNEDKRRAVLCLLNDPEWAAWSDREIARRCGVDHKTVAAARPQVSGEIPQMADKAPAATRTVQRGGAVYEQRVRGADPATKAPLPRPAPRPTYTTPYTDNPPELTQFVLWLRTGAQLVARLGDAADLRARMSGYGMPIPTDQVEAVIDFLSDIKGDDE